MGESFSSRLADLRARYRERLVDKADELARLIAAGERESVAAYLHRLGGTAGSYGLGRIAALALACETVLKDGGEEAQPWPDESLAELLELLGAASSGDDS